MFFIIFILCGLTIFPSFLYPSEKLLNRWIFVQNSIRNDADIASIEKVIRIGKSAGFNGLVLASRLDSLDLQPHDYSARVRQVKAICEKYNFDLAPCIFSIGYAGALLSHNKKLAEAYPVRDLFFKIAGHEALPYIVGKDPVEFTCSFENNEKEKMNELSLERPGKVSFIDKNVSHTGIASLKLDNFVYSPHGNARLFKELVVESYTSYEISFWYRAENLSQNSQVKIQIYKSNDRALIWRDSPKANNNWQKVTLEVNSLDNNGLKLYIGIWGGTTGRVWIDDLQIIRQSELVSLVHRDGAPIEVVDATTGRIYSEDSDFTITKKIPGSECYQIKINPHSRINNGSLLKVSYYREYVIGDGQVSACMAIPEVYAIWEKQIGLIEKLLHPKAYFLSMDEIRQAGYCGLCSNEDLSKLLGRCITTQYRMIKDVNPDADVYIWGDMLDPNMGAVNDYCMTKGGFPNAWQFVPKEIIPVVWNYGNREDSLAHFNRNGFKVMASVNVDESGTTEKLQEWKKTLRNYDNLMGFMFTTWHRDYSLLGYFREF